MILLKELLPGQTIRTYDLEKQKSVLVKKEKSQPPSHPPQKPSADKSKKLREWLGLKE